eukprot:scaffold103673_cov42-Phaeocystis_antarctica.AAC.1
MDHMSHLGEGCIGGLVLSEAGDDLGRDILRRAHEAGEALLLRPGARAAEVDELDHGRPLGGEDDVLRLEVAVHHVDAVQVLHSEAHLRQEGAVLTRARRLRPSCPRESRRAALRALCLRVYGWPGGRVRGTGAPGRRWRERSPP